MDIVPRKLVAAATMVLVADNKLAIVDFGHDMDDLVVGRTYFSSLFVFFRDFLSPTFICCRFKNKNYLAIIIWSLIANRIFCEL